MSEEIGLYEVEITFRVVIAAESERDAEVVFDGSRHDILSDCEPSVWASPLRAIPAEWGADGIPYSDLDDDHPRRDWTAEQWLAAEAEFDAKFDAKQIPLPIG